jgi:hypothetical protein
MIIPGPNGVLDHFKLVRPEICAKRPQMPF